MSLKKCVNNDRKMASGKWIISGTSLAQNFQNVVERHGSNQELLGLVLGNSKLAPNYISSVLFVKDEDGEGLKKTVAQVLSYLPADMELLGYAKFPSSGTDISKLCLNEGKTLQLCLKLPTPEELKQRNFKKLFNSNPQLTPKEDATQLMANNETETRQIFQLGFQFTFDVSKANEELNMCSDKLADVDLANSERSIVIGKTTSSTIEKIECKLKQIITLHPVQPINSSENSIPFTVNLAVFASKTVSDAELRQIILQQVKHIFSQAKTLLSSKKNELIKSVDCSAFSPSVGCFPLVHLVTLKSSNSQPTDDAACKQACTLLNLPNILPNFQSTQCLLVQKLEIAGLLTNPHESVKYPAKPQRIAVVNGRYQYHHYMQDGCDDSGWGCAYRSFQTVWSWFRLQHLTKKPVPSHREIQQCLVDIGDKPAKFVGSQQWIGSLELSFCLETMMGVSSRILNSKTGAMLGEHARAMIFHFENYGSPIMIGGGQLAQTILGIDYNVRSGETHFLVLDPHYTGNEDVNVIVKKGWCAWKPISFWDKKAFYNLLLPLTPKLNC